MLFLLIIFFRFSSQESIWVFILASNSLMALSVSVNRMGRYVDNGFSILYWEP